jgi:protein phosphatase
MLTIDGVDGDIYLLCSDGLTSMVPEAKVEEILRSKGTLASAGRALIAAANAAGGRDNITVILFRLEEVKGTPARAPKPGRRRSSTRSATDAPPPTRATAATVRDEMPGAGIEAQTLRDGYYTRPPRQPRTRRLAPRMPVVGSTRSGQPRRRRFRRAGPIIAILAVLAVIVTGAVLAIQTVYFVSTTANGQVTIYNGVPYALPGGVRLYTPYFVSGITAAELSKGERTRLFNNELRSQAAASNLVRQLELHEVQGQ